VLGAGGYAPQPARLVAGETDDDMRRETLGTLASYLHDIEWRGNLPFAATLSSSAPKAGRRDLQRLSDLKFANREVLEALVDPTFDSVTETQAHLVGRLLDYICSSSSEKATARH
jgi:hypothetical protein